MNNTNILKEYAKKWLEIALSPQNQEKRALWRQHNDRKAQRPAILVETCLMTDYVTEDELHCEDAFLRGIEKLMLENIRHAGEIGDDFVLEPYYRLPWQVQTSGFGLEIPKKTSVDQNSIGYVFDHPVKTEEDISLLARPVYRVCREETLQRAERLNDLFGDILPVKIGGIDPIYDENPGYTPFCGLCDTRMVLNLYKLVGMDNIFFWLYDKPELIHRLMRFVTDDFIEQYKFMEREGLLANNDCNVLTSGRYGYNSGAAGEDALRTDALWLWAYAEETTSISPKMDYEFIYPYLKEATSVFGKVYFGCCENLDSRWEGIEKYIQNLKAVSVSPFSDVFRMGEQIGGRYIFSRKPHPAYLSSSCPDWPKAEEDIENTLKAAKNCTLEIILRGVYSVFGNRSALNQWVRMVHSKL